MENSAVFEKLNTESKKYFLSINGQASPWAECHELLIEKNRLIYIVDKWRCHWMVVLFPVMTDRMNHIGWLDWNEREVSSWDAVGVHVESQLWSGTACVRGSGIAVLSAESADGVRAATIADCRKAYGGGNSKWLYDCVPYTSVCGDWIHHKLCRPADVVQAI